MVITFASHAKGPRFDPGTKHFCSTSICESYRRGDSEINCSVKLLPISYWLFLLVVSSNWYLSLCDRLDTDFGRFSISSNLFDELPCICCFGTFRFYAHEFVARRANDNSWFCIYQQSIRSPVPLPFSDSNSNCSILECFKCLSPPSAPASR